MPSRFIPEDTINDIRRQVDIVDVISEYVRLEKTGQNYKGLCPFHKEKTPSFVVNPAKQIFHCYGCGKGGNAFTFLMEHEKYSFPEAIRALAKRLGINLPEQQADPAAAQQARRNDALYQLHQDAAQYFADQLLNRPEAENARAYLLRRGIERDALAQIGFGYALPAWDGLHSRFARTYPLDALFESGLIIKRQNASGAYDRFRDRLMIPIHDERGRVIAFGGRILGDGEPKYLNSPESAIFHKGRTLFGFHLTKDAARRAGSIVLVEGYFDMIVPYLRGIPNIAATMGTALTGEHLHMLQRFVRKIVLVFDPDPAGVNAMIRTLDLFLASGFEARAAVLPGGGDPDTFVRTSGAEAFQRIIDAAPPLLDFIRDRIIERYDIARLDQQIACANHLLPTLVKIQNIIERNAQIARTADLLRITDGAILEEFRKAAQTGVVKIRPKTPENAPTVTAIPIVEQYLICALLKDKSLIPTIQRALTPEELTHPLAQRVLKMLLKYGDKTDFEAKMLDMFQGTAYQGELSRLFLGADQIIDPAATARDCVVRLRQMPFTQATLDVTRKAHEAQERNDTNGFEAFFAQKNADLLKKRQELSATQHEKEAKHAKK